MTMSQRKRTESIVLAVIAVISVTPLRYFVESRAWFIAEFVTLLGMFVVAEVGKTFRVARPKLLANSATGLLAITPIVFAVLARVFASPIAFEMSALSTFAAGSLALAMGSGHDRTRAMSIVAGGFLILFATSISDNSRTVLLAILWMAICVWHLVTNHWEKLELCMPDTVRSSVGIRPFSAVASITLCIIGGLVVHDRVGESNRFSFGIMPTSGGSKWSDSAARTGIGTGDAAIAAKDHAESFGAVESDIFLESTESSLFDMFSDSIGEPKKTKTAARAQAMGNENVLPLHERAAKSEQGGTSFSTDRMPPKQHTHFSDKVEDAVIQWDGPTGIRLATDRFDNFDGVQWTNTATHRNEKLSRCDLDQSVWFFDPTAEPRALKQSENVSVNLLKVLRLASPRLPVPMMTSGLHIKDIDRQDFFGIEDDGSFFMPGRDLVPPLTIVNVASLSVMEDELIGLNAQNLGSPRPASGRGAGAEGCSAYEQLQSMVSHLRTEFTFDRNTENSVEGFLQTRRGGDHLFATVAALKAREIGLESRLVTGFYVRPESFDITAGHANVSSGDVHVWVEIKLADGRWFEIEPSPGYREPVYTPSLWLVTKRFAAAHWIHGLLAIVASGLLYSTRLIWIEWLLTGVWLVSGILRPKRQLGLAMRIVETRARLIGSARPTGKPQRDWLESLVARDVHLQDHVKQFCDVADQTIFGESGSIERRRLSTVVRALKTKQLKLATHKATA